MSRFSLLYVQLSIPTHLSGSCLCTRCSYRETRGDERRGVCRCVVGMIGCREDVCVFCLSRWPARIEPVICQGACACGLVSDQDATLGCFSRHNFQFTVGNRPTVAYRYRRPSHLQYRSYTVMATRPELLAQSSTVRGRLDSVRLRYFLLGLQTRFHREILAIWIEIDHKTSHCLKQMISHAFNTKFWQTMNGTCFLGQMQFTWPSSALHRHPVFLNLPNCDPAFN